MAVDTETSSGVVRSLIPARLEAVARPLSMVASTAIPRAAGATTAFSPRADT